VLGQSHAQDSLPAGPAAMGCLCLFWTLAAPRSCCHADQGRAGLAARKIRCLLLCPQVSCRPCKAMWRPGRRMRPRTRGCLRCRPGACCRAPGVPVHATHSPCLCKGLADISRRKAVLSLAQDFGSVLRTAHGGSIARSCVPYVMRQAPLGATRAHRALARRYGAMGGVVPAPPGGAGGGGAALGAGLLELRLSCAAAGGGARSVVKRVPGAPPARPETQQALCRPACARRARPDVKRVPGARSCSVAWGRMLQLRARCAQESVWIKHVC